MSEIWKDVVGYEGRYQVSNLGRVKSLPNLRRKTELILKQTERRDRRFCVNLTSTDENGNWRQRVYQVHWLVAAAFIGPYQPETGLEVCHNDDNCQNNRADNLRYDTREGIVADRVKHDICNRGETNGMAVFDEATVKLIRRRLLEGEKVVALAKEYGVCHGAISAIKTKRHWRHV